MRRLSQSTGNVVMLKAFLSTDHISPATGKTVAITISKGGGAFGNPNAGATNATEVSNGWYKVTLDATDTGTLGDLVIRGTASLCDDSEQICQVVSASTGGASNLDAQVSTRAAATALATAQAGIDDLPTNAELATALAGADDAVLAQIALVKSVTDAFTFGVAGVVDANITYVNEVAVNGNGSGVPWGP